ncbi:hypothetical protein QM012_009209 [Aureobasidium pullulans]|uniref:Uncharacterized protein n=1 Tax=Aureobasidium pullulans TaxID=5580 RepID=A0ABR0TG71_AURPU
MSTTNNTNAATANTPQVVPEYRIKVIKIMNTEEAKKKESIALLIPQPSPYGHARLYQDFRWSNAQRDRFLADGTLPFDATNIPSNLKPAPIGMWIFDGRGSTIDSMPEIELDPLPDLERNKAIVVIDFGIPDHLCMIPPGLCRLIPTDPGKARLEPSFGNWS